MSTTQTSPRPRTDETAELERDELEPIQTAPDSPEPATASPETPAAPTFGLSATAVVAGALAAVTSAVAGSHLGTAGTLLGAAFGSIIGAVATASYSYGIQRTRHALRGLNLRRAKVIGGVLVLAAAAFLVALVAITGIEKVTGSTLAGTPGTTVEAARTGGVASDRGTRTTADRPADPAASPTPTATATQTATPSPTPTASPAPSGTPTPEPSPSSSAPTVAPTTPAAAPAASTTGA